LGLCTEIQKKKVQKNEAGKEEMGLWERKYSLIAEQSKRAGSEDARKLGDPEGRASGVLRESPKLPWRPKDPGSKTHAT